MNVGRLKVGAECVGGVLIATFFVVLLSYIFSFLGTIFCAALAGMMLGALRTKKWRSIPISLIFPLVIFGLLRGMKAELSGHQLLVITVACFSVFWLAYAVAAALFVLERPKHNDAARPARTDAVCVAKAADEASIPTAVAPASGVPGADGLLSLEMLQGNWSSDGNTQAVTEKRRLSFENETLTLSVADSGDRVKVLARARVRLCSSESQASLQISQT